MIRRLSRLLMMNRHDRSTAALPANDSSLASRGKLGLIAGHGGLPISLARAAREQGYQVVAVAVVSEATEELADHVDSIYWVDLGNLSRAIETFRDEGVRELVLAGKIRKSRIFELDGIENRLVRVVEGLRARGDDAVLRAIVRELERSGLKVVESASLLAECIPEAGVLGERHPTPLELEDVTYGLQMARAVADLGIGQTLVVKSRVVVAVEAIEGTDDTIRRAGREAGGGFAVVKVSGPRQDTRFDLPVIGRTTIDVVAASGGAVLAVEAGRTVILEKSSVIERADAAGIALVAV